MILANERHGRDPILDGLRAAAAGLVLLSHARVLLFRDAADQPGLSWAAAIFFGVSGLGHAAVLVFFVMSGLLVTEAMLRLEARGQWSLATFGLGRLVRLWIVLVPCLALGACLDRMGLALAGTVPPYGIPPVGHMPLVPALGLDVVVGNLLFLQTIAVPVLGSNGPLWSLANEAWYYLLAALGFAAWQARHQPGRALVAAITALIALVLLPKPIVALAPVWLCGAGVALLRRRPWRLPRMFRCVAGWAAAALFGVILFVARLHHGPESFCLDIALGLAVAVLLLAVLPNRRNSRVGHAWMRRAAEASYSVYLSHVPVLSFFAILTVGPQRLPAGPQAFGLLLVALAAAGGVGWAVWWAFERHTGRVRAWIASRPSGLHARPLGFGRAWP